MLYKLAAFLKQHPQLTLAGFAVILMLPAFIRGAGPGDPFPHFISAEAMAQAFWAGDLYPRWLPDINAGYGSSMFFYYPPLPTLSTVFFAPLQHLDAFGYYPLAASALLALMFSGWTCYGWLRDTMQPRAALAGAVIYMAAPMHLTHDFYASMLFGQFWAYAWLPLILRYAARMETARDITGYATGQALLFLSNLPIALIVSPLPFIHALLFRPRLLPRLAVGAILACGLAACFLLPMAMYRHAALLDTFWSKDVLGFSFTDLLFRPSLLNATDHIIVMPMKLFPFHLLAMLFFWLAGRRARPENEWFIIGLCYGAMAFPFTEFLYRAFPILTLPQFPSRYLLPTGLSIAFLAAAYVQAGKPAHRVWAVSALFFAVAVGVALQGKITPESVAQSNPQTMKAWEYRILPHPTYMPSWKSVEYFYDDRVFEAYTKHVPFIQGVNAEAKLLWRHARDIGLEVNAKAGGSIAVRQFYFPGWEARAGDTVLPVERDARLDTLVIRFPAAMERQTIQLKLKALWPERVGYALSLVTALLLGIGCVYSQKQRAFRA